MKARKINNFNSIQPFLAITFWISFEGCRGRGLWGGRWRGCHPPSQKEQTRRWGRRWECQKEKRACQWWRRRWGAKVIYLYFLYKLFFKFGVCYPNMSNPESVNSLECNFVLEQAEKSFESWTYWDTASGRVFWDDQGKLVTSLATYFPGSLVYTSKKE